MDVFELKRIPFINPTGDLKSFSLRIAALLSYQDKYVMVQNEGESKYKHPGGHLNSNENLESGLIREIQEETGYEIESVLLNGVFFDNVLTSKENLMIGAYIHIPIDKQTVDSILANSPLPTKVFAFEELTEENSWETEIRAIRHYLANR